jgi:hypothetical protein
MSPKFDGQRVRDFWTSEAEALLATYTQFSTLVPSPKTRGAGHPGEDGRFVEALLRSFLRRFLPTSVTVATGFILRPAVKTGIHGYERRGQEDAHSGQLDVLVYDSNYPVFHRLEDSVVVPPESVLAIISVKKTLRERDIPHEVRSLHDASKLCRCLDGKNRALRGPFLAIVAATAAINKKRTSFESNVFSQVQKADANDTYFDETPGCIGILDRGVIFKQRPMAKDVKEAKYLWFKQGEHERHLTLQFLLTGVLSAFYDTGRTDRRRPGYNAFEARPPDATLGTLKVQGLRAGARRTGA